MLICEHIIKIRSLYVSKITTILYVYHTFYLTNQFVKHRFLYFGYVVINLNITLNLLKIIIISFNIIINGNLIICFVVMMISLEEIFIELNMIKSVTRKYSKQIMYS